MYDFIPVKSYYDVFYYFMLFVCIIAFFHTQVLQPDEQKAKSFNSVGSWGLFMLILTFIGFRPVSGVFIDMTTYAHIFERYSYGAYVIDSDYGFSYFILFCTKTMTLESFFFICAIIYVVPLFVVSKKWFPNYHFYAFLLLVASMSFFAYGVNGIRNGMATSLFIMALSYYKRNTILMILFFIISLSFHTSMLLPLAAFVLSYFVTDTKKYYFFWILSIILSISMGGIWENIFASIGFGDDRFATYLTADVDARRFASIGFRYDFLAYSAVPIILSIHYKYKKGYESIIYDRILHTYMITNGFWIMIIRANYSNRFAYLSWFLMALVVIYPILDKKLWDNQYKKLGYLLIFYYAFTFLLYLKYA